MEKLGQFISTPFFTFTVSGREIVIFIGLVLATLAILGILKWKKNRDLIDEDLKNAAKEPQDKNEISLKKDSQVLFDSRLNESKEPSQLNLETSLPESIPQEKSAAPDSFYDKRIENLYNKRQESVSGDKNKESSRLKILVISAVSILVIGAFFCGAWFYLKNKKMADAPEKKSILEAENSISIPEPEVKVEEDSQGIQPENSKEEKTEETKTEEKKDPSVVKVLVLNGGATGGSAGKIKQKLIDLGYKKAEADNAKSSNHTGQAVYYLEGFETSSQEIAEALKSQYPKITAEKAESTEEKSAEIVIILGQ